MNVNYICQVNFHPVLHCKKGLKLMNHLPFEVSFIELRANHMNLGDIVLSNLEFNLVNTYLSLENGSDD